MNILSLDFGTKTGYCSGDSDFDNLIAGTWKLATAKEITGWRKTRQDRTCDPRIRRLWVQLCNFLQQDLVVFEDVEFSSYTKQTQLWAGFRTTAWLAFPEKKRYECVPVGILKKFATGHGNATKDMMKAALLKHPIRYNLQSPLDDNVVDAIWIWLWAKQNLSRFIS